MVKGLSSVSSSKHVSLVCPQGRFKTEDKVLRKLYTSITHQYREKMLNPETIKEITINLTKLFIFKANITKQNLNCNIMRTNHGLEKHL